MRERLFREDLFYRLQVVPLRVPPLRDALNAHRWPGNVRELRNVIERSLAFEPLPPVLGAEHLRIT